jgi:hypothetical protein
LKPVIKDEFLSEEDLDLFHMTFEERVAYWNLWLRQAQATNNQDAREYSHGVMVGYQEPLPADQDRSDLHA